MTQHNHTKRIERLEELRARQAPTPARELHPTEWDELDRLLLAKLTGELRGEAVERLERLLMLAPSPLDPADPRLPLFGAELSSRLGLRPTPEEIAAGHDEELS